MKKIIRKLFYWALSEELNDLSAVVRVNYQTSKDLNNLTNRFDKFVTYKGEDKQIKELQADLKDLKKRLNNNIKGLHGRIRYLEKGK